MSSEDSVTTTTSSRLRQFGLYRTIDSRTEEFLKLSKRRQIRQGCVCAAVSTAITVTVVVSVLLVYEYGFHVDSELKSRSKHRPYWFNMFNDTETSFEKNVLHRANFNIDRSTLKLLPLILKALKQNEYFEKVIEENSSQPPPVEKYTTDFPLQRNIFTDARNWIRMPAQRMYAIEYKTSPIVFLKTKNLDEYAKARKMMDSQRIINYLHRMINEKISYGPVMQELNTNIESQSTTERPKHNIIRNKNADTIKRTKPAKTNNAHISKEKPIINCKCSKQFGEILNKIVHSIQQLIPENHENNLDVSSPCPNSKPKMNDISGNHKIPKSITSTTPKPIMTKRYLTNKTNHPAHSKPFYLKPLKLRPHSKIRNLQDNIMFPNVKTFKNKETYMDLTDSIIRQTSKQTHGSNEIDDSKNIELTNTMKAYIEPTEYVQFNKHTIAEPMTKSTENEPTRGATLVENFEVNRPHTRSNYNGIYYESNMNDATTEAVPKTSTISYKSTNEDMSVTKFLRKYRDSQKLNRFQDNRLISFPIIKNKMKPILPQRTNHSVLKDESSTKTNDKFKETSNAIIDDIAKRSTDHDRSNSNTKDNFETVLPDLIRVDTTRLPTSTPTSNAHHKANSGLRELSRSMIPQSRPPFLKITRNDGRHKNQEYEDHINWNYNTDEE